MSEVRATAPAGSPGRRLRDAIEAGPVMLPGVFNPLVARIAERAGFQAVYLSGAALSASLGLPDVGLVALPEFVDAARAITAATDLPLVCDADTGFGEALNVERTVREFEAAGVAGIHLEDQQLPKRCGHLSGKQLVEPQEMAAKLRAAAAARKDRDFFLIARTDARGVTGFADAVKRAHLYREAGADAIFPEALESEAEFAAFAKEVPEPLIANMTEFGKSPLIDARQVADLGYRLILYPVSALRVALKAVEEFFAELTQAGTQKNPVGRMLTRTQLYDLLGYTGYEERDQAYFGGR
jgi:methylisocitrate lyase